MKTYIVGGWVRDRLLAAAGRATPPGDRDWVVVGAHPQEMLERGFLPVGRDFPVFLHPQTREEYALARTERKTAPGYRGFAVHAAPEVTLEDDLQRRDLTINAMAMDEAGALIDPHGGGADLRARVLRHVGPAFVEDPVRILRLARFAARFPDFTVAPATEALLRAMVEGGEAAALVPERVWQELARGLMEDAPQRMVEVLEGCGLLARILPGLRPGPALGVILERAVRAAAPLPVRYALLAAAAADAASVRAWPATVRVDSESQQLAQLLCDLRHDLARAAELSSAMASLERADAVRRPARFELLLEAWGLLEDASTSVWRELLRAARSIDAGAVAARCGPDPQAIAQAVASARRAAVAQALARVPTQAPAQAHAQAPPVEAHAQAPPVEGDSDTVPDQGPGAPRR